MTNTTKKHIEHPTSRNRRLLVVSVIAWSMVCIGCGRAVESTRDTYSKKTHPKKQVPCDKPSNLACEPGMVDACDIGAAPVHECVPAGDEPNICQPGLRDACELGPDGVPVCFCVPLDELYCDRPFALICEPGMVDACDIGAAPEHICVPTNDDPCNEPSNLICPPGTIDVCELDERGVPVHTCAPTTDDPPCDGCWPEGDVPCDQPSDLTCPPEWIDACDVNFGSFHTCVLSVSCSASINLDCPPDMYDACDVDPNAPVHRCVWVTAYGTPSS